jgi:exosortase
MDKTETIGVLDQFQTELVGNWKRLPNKGFFFVLLAAWIALFHFLGNPTLGYVNSSSLFRWTLNAYEPNGHYLDSESGYGILVPFAVLVLFWFKRKELMSLPLRLWWPGLLIAGFALALHIFGFMIQQPRISLVAFFGGIYGLMGLAWGWRWLRNSFFPFVLFAFCIPLGGLIEAITFRLRVLVCQIVEMISHLILAIDINRNGTELMDPTGNYHYEVAAACSGMRSLVATLAIAMVFALMSFQTWGKRAMMIASAVPLAVLGNVIRMMTIIITADVWGQSAGNYVHEGGPGGIFSLLPYVPVFIGLILLERWLNKEEPKPTLPLEPRTT